MKKNIKTKRNIYNNQIQKSTYKVLGPNIFLFYSFSLPAGL